MKRPPPAPGHGRAEQVLTRLAAAVSEGSGPALLRSLTRGIAHALEADTAWIATPAASDGSRMRTVATWSTGGWVDDFEYEVAAAGFAELADDPVITMLDDSMPLPAGFQARVCAMVPLRTSPQRLMGALLVLWQRDESSSELIEPALRLVGSRAAVELERVASRARWRRTRELLKRQAMTLGNSTTAAAPEPESLRQVLDRLVEAAAHALITSQVEVWLYDRSHLGMDCVAHFDFHGDGHGPSHRLERASYPHWFDLMDQKETLVAESCSSSPALAPFVGPDGCAGIDVPIARRGRTLGVLRIQDVGRERRWEAEEQIFAASLADRVVLALEADERHRLEEQLQQAQKLEGIGRLAGGVAHDFNNLLTVIFGCVELARMASMDPEVTDLLSEIQAASDRAAELTRQLLSFAAKRTTAPEVVSPNQIVRSIRKLLRRVLGENVTLEVELDPDVPQVLVGQGQGEQLLMNLAVNARDAMPHGGVIRVATQTLKADAFPYLSSRGEHGRWVRIQVSDTGIGMDRATLDQVFDPFFTTKPQGQGTGLGLSMVYGLVRQVGGHVDIASEVGNGTTVDLYLPEHTGPEPSKTPELSEGPPVGDEALLLLEDDPRVRRSTAAGLRAFGYDVLTAATIEEARSELHKRHDVALLITDVVMPRITGLQAAAELTGMRPNLPVLFMSGHADDLIVWHGLLDTRLPFIAKPFRPGDLARRVRSLLDGPPAA